MRSRRDDENINWKEKRDIFIENAMSAPYNKSYETACSYWMILSEEVPEALEAGITHAA